MDAENQPQPQTTTDLKPISFQLSNLLALTKDFGTWLYAVAVGTLYAVGFLVLNSNLAKSGVLDVEFVDARYFIAGASFAFFLVCFYLFAGRAVIFSPRWLREDLERVNRISSTPIWSFVVFTHSFITAIFFCCLSAVLFTSFSIGNDESTFFYIALAGPFLVLYTFDITNWDLRFPRIFESVTIVVKLVAICTFFASIRSGEMLTVFANYIAIFFFINLVFDSFARYKLTADRVTFSGIYSVVFVLGTSIGFGTSLYGKVTSKLGGARPQTVSVGLSDEARKSLPVAIAASPNQSLEGRLIHQTSAHTYVEFSGKTVRFRTADVITLVFTPEFERDFWKEYLQRHVTSQLSPNSAR